MVDCCHFKKTFSRHVHATVQNIVMKFCIVMPSVTVQGCEVYTVDN